MKPATLFRSDELLTHFQCQGCHGWWSIGDFYLHIKKQPIWRLYCPWCGIAHRVLEVDDDEQ